MLITHRWYRRSLLSSSYAVRLFFFSSRRRHTRFDCDWSSDVCSSDLAVVTGRAVEGDVAGARLDLADGELRDRRGPARCEIGRGSCRERGEISGGAGSLKKKKEDNRSSRVHDHAWRAYYGHAVTQYRV